MKNILVIGASSGYGLGVAHYMNINSECRLFTSSRTNPEHDDNDLYLDVTSEGSVISMVEYLKVHDFDLVVYSAGLAIGTDTVINKSIADYDKVMDTNTRGLYIVSKHIFPLLHRRNGLFIHIGSISHEGSYVGGVDYCATKAASHSIMKGLRVEWIGTGVRTCSIEIGMGDTPFHRKRYGADMERHAARIDGVKKITGEDLGRLVHFLSETPGHLNFDTIYFKPLDQAGHGMEYLSNYKKD